MSKRKRNAANSKKSQARRKQASKSAPDSAESSVGATTDAAASANAKTDKPPKKSQRGLLALAIVLLVAAAVLNVRGWRKTQVVLPDPIPLPSEAVTSRPLAQPSSRSSGANGNETRFTALSPTETGVDFTHPVLPDHPMAYLYFSSPASGGTAIGDVNNDGRPDLFIASGPSENRLYLQQADQSLSFVDVTEDAGVGGGEAWACGATMVDVNADGRLDIYVANYDAPNSLYINLGDGKFADLATDYGLNLVDASLEGVFADFDRDGWLDMYLLTYRYENPSGMPASPPITGSGRQRKIETEFENFYEITDDTIGYGTVGRADGLMRNKGDGTFENVSEKAGIRGIGHGQSATWWDFNQDGWLDLFVGNDFNDADLLYENNRDGTFSNVIRDRVPHTSWFSMGADCGDLDGDGLFDLLTADMSSTTHFKQKTTMGAMGDSAEFLATAIPRQYMRNALLMNSGTDRFKEAAYLAGLDSTDWTWCVKLADLDCDGKLDVFFTNGSVRSFSDSDRSLTLEQRKGKTEWDLYKDTEPLREKNLAFRNVSNVSNASGASNDGDSNGGSSLAFEDVSEAWGVAHLGVSMSSAHGDLDGDGDLDLVVAHLDQPLTIYRNDSPENNRITMRLHGLGGNRFGIGAKVTVATTAGKQVRELHPSRGFLASNQPILHFGIGDDESVDATITWPSGAVQKLSRMAAGKHYEVTEQSNLPAAKRESITPMFQTGDIANETLIHRENEFDDYAIQSLIPHRMSRLGPALASADVDGDGDVDFFVGGAAGQPGRVALVEADKFSTLTIAETPDLVADLAAEDMGAVWLDVDGDGDEDLFVVGGGNEQPATSDVYLWRLYLNDGKGGLKRAKDRLPNIRVSGGPVAAADFDQDGDIDLFVGGRQVPGKYPLPARSYLLENEGGKFTDATAKVIGDVADVGMVTGALWSDVDNDADLDLLVTTEWGHIHLFRNAGGALSEDSEAAGLANKRGWWTGITGADLDNDGDIDYIATNLGTNTKYHADDSHPFRLFYGDFEGNGERKLVEAEYENDVLFPVRGKSCSTHAMPSLESRFPTYRGFALATLQDLYTPKCLEEAYECSANTLVSVALLNDGEGHFTAKPLPTEAQLSPCFGCVVHDWTADGVADVFLTQNFHSPQPETGNFDGGLGCLLAGDGKGGFRALHTQETGIVIPEDATAAFMTPLQLNGEPELVVATNNGKLKRIVGVSESEGYGNAADDVTRTMELSFAGVGSSSSLAGTRVEVASKGSALKRTFEFAAGSGYLSQQSPVLFFPVLNNDCTVKVTRPGKKTVEISLTPKQQRIVIESVD